MTVSGDDVDGEVAGSDDERQPADLSRGAQLGRYLVLDLLGRGGMGVVVAAYDPELDRKVALKLLRVGPSGHGESRLLREAQALARLNHPNVITIYDVGALGDRVFLAMEYVRGETLSAWLRGEQRTTEDIVRTFLQAGRGLEAAHRAGLVHRDVKPGNVLVGDDGRVLVVDFGLACADDAGTAAPQYDGPVVDLERLAEASTETLATPLERELMRAGAVMGTPTYMAPEQRAGQADIGPAAAQYSFCLSLHLALYGELPAGAGPLPKPPLDQPAAGGRRPPPRARRVLQRGLSAKPDDRYPTMTALLEDLETSVLRVRWRRRLVASVILLAVFAAGWVYRTTIDRQTALCTGGESRLGSLWGASQQQDIRLAFSATGAPFADDAWRGTSAIVDRYRQDWLDMYASACRATHVRGEQSTELLDLRMACLDHRQQELSALLRLLDGADRPLVQRAVALAGRLTPLGACADSSALLAPMPPPADGLARQRVAAVGRRLAEIKVQYDAARYADGLAAIGPLLEQSQDIGYWPLIADVHLRQGILFEGQRDSRSAETSLEQALRAAAAGGHDRTAAEAFIHLVRVAGHQQQDVDRALSYAAHARALLTQLGGQPDLRAMLADNVGTVYLQQGKPEAALDYHRQALTLAQQAFGDDSPQVAASLTRIGRGYTEIGENGRARQVLERAETLYRSALGPRHPQVAVALDQLGHALTMLGEHDLALDRHRQALDIRRLVFGERHVEVAKSLIGMANDLGSLGRVDEARDTWRQALGLLELEHGADHPHVAIALSGLASSLVAGGYHSGEGKGEEALALYERALDIQQAAYGDDHPWLTVTVFNLGVAYQQLGRHPQALAAFERARRAWQQQRPDHPNLISALTGEGEALLAMGRAPEAIEALEPAQDLCQQAADVSPMVRADVELQLARALLASERDLERAGELAQSAESRLVDAGSAGAEQLADVRQLLASLR